MSRYQTIKEIRQEIDRLNQEIDLRIIRGISYAKEARRHKFLMSQLRRLRPSTLAWLSRSLSFASMFLF
ncbi:MAG: hypothetical protein WCV79_01410 [Candidatus Paceibacterota bacterium]